MPCIEDMRTLCGWNIRITCQGDHLPLASGKLVRIEEHKDGTKTYFYKTVASTNSVRMGICVGQFRCAATQDHPGVFYFAATKKALDHIESYLVPNKVVKEVLSPRAML